MTHLLQKRMMPDLRPMELQMQRRNWATPLTRGEYESFVTRAATRVALVVYVVGMVALFTNHRGRLFWDLVALFPERRFWVVCGALVALAGALPITARLSSRRITAFRFKNSPER